MPRKAKVAGATLQHVHETTESVASIELTPPHPPRQDTPEYQQTHHLLVFEKDTPCKVCGVRHSTLADPAANTVGAQAIETHHYPVERSLIDAVDWRKVHADFPAVYSQASLIMWVDSPENMLTLCDVHHRSPEHGIHHLLTQDFAVAPYLLDGYQVAARAQDVAAALAHDEQIEQTTGIEQSVSSAARISTALPPAPQPKRRAATRRRPRAATRATAPTA